MGATTRENFSRKWRAVELPRVISLFHCRSLKESMETRDNNYTVVRLLLSASVIFFHAFAISGDKSLHNPTNRFLWPITDMGGLAVGMFFFLSGLFVSQSYLGDPNVFRFVSKRFLRIFLDYLYAFLSHQYWRYCLMTRDMRFHIFRQCLSTNT